MRGWHVVIEGQSMFRRLSAPTTFQRMRVACTPLRILVDPLVDSIQTKMQYPEIRSHGPPRRVPESFHEKDPSHTVTVSVLKTFLAHFAFCILLQSRTRADNGGNHFI
jgi:hypothetical protein